MKFLPFSCSLDFYFCILYAVYSHKFVFGCCCWSFRSISFMFCREQTQVHAAHSHPHRNRSKWEKGQCCGACCSYTTSLSRYFAFESHKRITKTRTTSHRIQKTNMTGWIQKLYNQLVSRVLHTNRFHPFNTVMMYSFPPIPNSKSLVFFFLQLCFRFDVPSFYYFFCESSHFGTHIAKSLLPCAVCGVSPRQTSIQSLRNRTSTEMSIGLCKKKDSHWMKVNGFC